MTPVHQEGGAPPTLKERVTYQVDVWDLGRIVHTRSFFHRRQAEEYADQWEARRYLVGVTERSARPWRYCDKCQEPVVLDEVAVYGILEVCEGCKQRSRTGKRRIAHRLKARRRERQRPR